MSSGVAADAPASRVPSLNRVSYRNRSGFERIDEVIQVRRFTQGHRRVDVVTVGRRSDAMVIARMYDRDGFLGASVRKDMHDAEGFAWYFLGLLSD